MSRKSWLVGGVVLVLVSGILWFGVGINTFASPITVTEATKKVEHLYKGEIVSIKEHKMNFVISMTLSTGEYDVTIDRESGEITNMTRTKEYRSPSENISNKETEQPTNPTSSIVPVKLITEEEAIQTALQKINGTLEEIELKQSNEESYYLVEIEKNGEKEGTVQIHAITGEVISITWDD